VELERDMFIVLIGGAYGRFVPHLLVLVNEPLAVSSRVRHIQYFWCFLHVTLAITTGSLYIMVLWRPFFRLVDIAYRSFHCRIQPTHIESNSLCKR
jgi:hypothetical protein